MNRSPPVVAGTKRGTEEALELSSDEESQTAHRPTKVTKTGGASPELSALYERVFGTKEWYSTFTRRVNQDRAWGLEAEDVFTSMVAAAIYEDVFTAKQPWGLSDSIKDALGDRYKFFEETIKDEGHNLDILLKVCWYKVVDDKEV
ncbi:hypothetical protein AC578_3118 [Pseudocercospora eumusae]|uniref:Uncharacterized protein n=1 Tax=Pseudocercospora eumusae TaxID=321146 RepID=A0A139H6H2_9PEZI|nr:hypothetical protein AC578_3118 [Pseudocercospora eumusae]